MVVAGVFVFTYKITSTIIAPGGNNLRLSGAGVRWGARCGPCGLGARWRAVWVGVGVVACRGRVRWGRSVARGCGWRAPFDRLRANGIARRDYGALGMWVAGAPSTGSGRTESRGAPTVPWGCGWRAPSTGSGRTDREARLRCFGGVGGGPLRQAQGERNREARSSTVRLGVWVAGPPSTGSGRKDARRPFERLRRGFQFTLGELGVRARACGAITGARLLTTGARLLTGAQLRDTVLQRQCRVASHVLLKGGGFFDSPPYLSGNVKGGDMIGRHIFLVWRLQG